MILQDKTILVSGVGPGLGREIASRVLRDGGRVVIGARKAESLEAAAKELDPSGERVLAHAFDPFFSAKPAGRQPGLGLSRAQRIVEGHGGRLTLENGPQGGAVATIRLSRWRGEGGEERMVA